MSSAVEYEMDAIDAKGMRNRSEILGGRPVKDEDTLALARSGKKQILDVSLNSLSFCI